MSFLPRTRLCHSPEPISARTPMEEKSAMAANTMLAAGIDDPELHYPFYHQRGRRRRRSPPPPPPSSVPLSLAMTTTPQQMLHRPYHPPPRMRHNNPRPRQQTPSGCSGTFRGRRRHRSPSVGATAAMAAAAAAAAAAVARKASSRSSRPHTRSSSAASSMQHVSRPSSPHEWWGSTTTTATTATTNTSNGSGSGSWLCRSVSRSRGRQVRRGVAAGSSAAAAARRTMESPSPRRKMAYRRPMEMDHSAMMAHHYHSHLNMLAPLPRPYTKPVTRRSHCPSRSGSAEGYYEDTGGSSAAAATDPIALAARRRRRRQRTQSRPRPRRMMSGDSATGASSNGGLYELAGYYAFDNDSPMARVDVDVDNPGDAAATAPSRLQFQMLLADSSDTTSDGDAMDVEMG